MDQAPAHFDWIGWLATIPGIPAGWGLAPADPAPAFVAPSAESLPPRAAARVVEPHAGERLAA